MTMHFADGIRASGEHVRLLSDARADRHGPLPTHSLPRQMVMLPCLTCPADANAFCCRRLAAKAPIICYLVVWLASLMVAAPYFFAVSAEDVTEFDPWDRPYVAHMVRCG